MKSFQKEIINIVLFVFSVPFFTSLRGGKYSDSPYSSSALLTSLFVLVFLISVIKIPYYIAVRLKLFITPILDVFNTTSLVFILITFVVLIIALIGIHYNVRKYCNEAELKLAIRDRSVLINNLYEVLLFLAFMTLLSFVLLF
jgi:hypothetical protein